MHLPSQASSIPNTHVIIANNVIINPSGYKSQWQHLSIYGPTLSKVRQETRGTLPLVIDATGIL